MLPEGSRARWYVRNDVRHVFVSQEKKTFFYEKIFFRTLHYSTAMLESSLIMENHENHEKA